MVQAKSADQHVSGIELIEIRHGLDDFWRFMPSFSTGLSNSWSTAGNSLDAPRGGPSKCRRLQRAKTVTGAIEFCRRNRTSLERVPLSAGAGWDLVGRVCFDRGADSGGTWLPPSHNLRGGAHRVAELRD